MIKEVLQPEGVEVPEAPYPQAIEVRGINLLFVSEQTPSDFEGSLIGKGNPLSSQCRSRAIRAHFILDRIVTAEEGV